MEKTLALGVIGAGSIWKAHEKNLALIGGARVAAVCDQAAANREAVAAAHGARAYEQIADLFAGESGLDRFDGQQGVGRLLQSSASPTGGRCCPSVGRSARALFDLPFPQTRAMP